MLAKIYLINGEYHFFSCDSTHRKMSALEMQQFLKTFDEQRHYGVLKKEEISYGVLTPSTGELVAQVTSEKELLVLSPTFFLSVFQLDAPVFLTVEEYAEKVGKSVNMVGKLCRAGRLVGAYQQGSRWLIPENTPYPASSK